MSELPESIDRMVGFWVRNVPYTFVQFTGQGEDWTGYGRRYRLGRHQDEIRKVLERIQASCQNKYVKQYFQILSNTIAQKRDVQQEKVKYVNINYVEGKLYNDSSQGRVLGTLHETRFSIKEKYTPIDADIINRLEAFLNYCAMEVEGVLNAECVEREAPKTGIKTDYDLREWVEGMQIVGSQGTYQPLVFIPQYIAKTIELDKLTAGEIQMLWNIAVVSGYVDIVKKLLQDNRITTQMKNDAVKYSGAEDGHLNIVDLLVGQVNADVKNTALRIAIGSDHLDIVNRLLEEADIQPERTIPSQSHRIHYPLTLAVALNRLDIVNRLLEYGVNPSLGNNQALEVATEEGHVDIVKRLLADERLILSDRQRNFIYYLARDSYEILPILRDDIRFKDAIIAPW